MSKVKETPVANSWSNPKSSTAPPSNGVKSVWGNGNETMAAKLKRLEEEKKNPPPPPISAAVTEQLSEETGADGEVYCHKDLFDKTNLISSILKCL